MILCWSLRHMTVLIIYLGCSLGRSDALPSGIYIATSSTVLSTTDAGDQDWDSFDSCDCTRCCPVFGVGHRCVTVHSHCTHDYPRHERH